MGGASEGRRRPTGGAPGSLHVSSDSQMLLFLAFAGNGGVAPPSLTLCPPVCSSGGQTPRRDLEKQLTGEEK